MSNCAIILARGGSKGCPCKNKRLLNGTPLIVRAIRTAQASGVCDEIIVASDDSQIISAAIGEGVTAVLRDTVSDSQTSEEGLMELEPYFAKYQNMALIQCTAPFMLPGDISESLRLMQKNNHDSACVVAPFHGVVWNSEPFGFRLPRQEMPESFLEAGSVYWMKVSSFMIYRNRFCGKTGILVMPPERCFEIDTMADFAMAECLIKNMEGFDNEFFW